MPASCERASKRIFSELVQCSPGSVSVNEFCVHCLCRLDSFLGEFGVWSLDHLLWKSTPCAAPKVGMRGCLNEWSCKQHTLGFRKVNCSMDFITISFDLDTAKQRGTLNGPWREGEMKWTGPTFPDGDEVIGKIQGKVCWKINRIELEIVHLQGCNDASKVGGGTLLDPAQKAQEEIETERDRSCSTELATLFEIFFLLLLLFFLLLLTQGQHGQHQIH